MRSVTCGWCGAENIGTTPAGKLHTHNRADSPENPRVCAGSNQSIENISYWKSVGEGVTTE